MKWTYHFYCAEVLERMRALEPGHKADLAHFRGLIAQFDLQGLNPKQSNPLGDGLFEFRLRGKYTIARVFYCTISDHRIVYLHVIIKKVQKTPPAALAVARQRCSESKAQDATELKANATAAKKVRKGKNR